jgi:16S rRNA (cytidine1402-2'-O)-methyltransferase
LATTYAATPPRGEIAIVVGPPADDAPPETATLVNIDARLDAALAATSLKQAVADIAAATGLPRRVVYARALARKGRA